MGLSSARSIFNGFAGLGGGNDGLFCSIRPPTLLLEPGRHWQRASRNSDWRSGFIRWAATFKPLSRGKSVLFPVELMIKMAADSYSDFFLTCSMNSYPS